MNKIQLSDNLYSSWLVHGITGHTFETRHPSDDSDQVWFQLVWQF
jgi:hypothetical protein